MIVRLFSKPASCKNSLTGILEFSHHDNNSVISNFNKFLVYAFCFHIRKSHNIMFWSIFGTSVERNGGGGGAFVQYYAFHMHVSMHF